MTFLERWERCRKGMKMHSLESIFLSFMHARPSVPRKKRESRLGTALHCLRTAKKIWQVALVQASEPTDGGAFGRDGDGNLTGRRKEDKEDDCASSFYPMWKIEKL